ncbi:hypothetical protein Lal_00033335 [Lupinus albus]|nr:hypothetical protein Lal_00033335 [Lupinus albus]
MISVILLLNVNIVEHVCGKYELCCGVERVRKPLLKAPPPLLQNLLFDMNYSDSQNPQNHIRLYIMMFEFIFLGAKIDRSNINGIGPPTIRIQGQLNHTVLVAYCVCLDSSQSLHNYIFMTDSMKFKIG